MNGFVNFEQTIITGRAGAEPEGRFTPGGVAVTTFKIAVGRRFKREGDADYTEETEWYRCVAWGKTAEFANKFIEKGTPVQIVGVMRTRKWEDKETGQDRYITELKAESVIIQAGNGHRSSSESEYVDDVAPAQQSGQAARSGSQGSKPTQGPSRPAGASQRAAQRAPARNVPQAIDADDDLPF